MKLVKCKACKQPVSPSANSCPNCGHRRPGQRISPGATIFLLLVLIGGIFYFKGADSSPRNTSAAIRTERLPTSKGLDITAPIYPSNNTVIWNRLRSAYPDIPPGERAYWRDLIEGRVHVAVPDPFWDKLSIAERKQFAAELDELFRTSTWEVVTGRYVGNGNMMLDVGRSRSEVLADSGQPSP